MAAFANAEQRQIGRKMACNEYIDASLKCFWIDQGAEWGGFLAILAVFLVAHRRRFSAFSFD